MDFTVRVTTIWRGSSRVTENWRFANWHDALCNAVVHMEGLRRCAEDPERTSIIGYRVEIIEWLGASTYKTRLKAEYKNEDWRNERDGK